MRGARGEPFALVQTIAQQMVNSRFIEWAVGRRTGRQQKNLHNERCIYYNNVDEDRGDALCLLCSEVTVMSDINRDPFEEYIHHVEPSRKELGYAWYTAIGLQAVDGLKTSAYLMQTAQDNIEGKITLSEANALIETYYREAKKQKGDRTQEADQVSARIAALLSENAFSFSVMQYLGIHRRLFEGIYPHAGEVRDYNISKREWVLNGESVQYGSAPEIMATLEYELQMEREYRYPFGDMATTIEHLARFVASLWQIHAFGEGNTRTTAVFFIKYLRTLGFDVTNDIFAQNAWYFRNALVRANYNNYIIGVRKTTEYLELFLENLLLNERHVLRNRSMHIGGIMNKQDIEPKKQDIQSEKQDIEVLDAVKPKTKAHIERLLRAYGFKTVFGRSDIMKQLNLTASPASVLLKRMLQMNLIVPVTGLGKGKYTFRQTD